MALEAVYEQDFQDCSYVAKPRPTIAAAERDRAATLDRRKAHFCV